MSAVQPLRTHSALASSPSSTITPATTVNHPTSKSHHLQKAKKIVALLKRFNCPFTEEVRSVLLQDTAGASLSGTAFKPVGDNVDLGLNGTGGTKMDTLNAPAGMEDLSFVVGGLRRNGGSDQANEKFGVKVREGGTLSSKGRAASGSNLWVDAVEWLLVKFDARLSEAFPADDYPDSLQRVFEMASAIGLATQGTVELFEAKITQDAISFLYDLCMMVQYAVHCETACPNLLEDTTDIFEHDLISSGVNFLSSFCDDPNLLRSVLGFDGVGGENTINDNESDGSSSWCDEWDDGEDEYGAYDDDGDDAHSEDTLCDDRDATSKRALDRQKRSESLKNMEDTGGPSLELEQRYDVVLPGEFWDNLVTASNSVVDLPGFGGLDGMRKYVGVGAQCIEDGDDGGIKLIEEEFSDPHNLKGMSAELAQTRQSRFNRLKDECDALDAQYNFMSQTQTAEALDSLQTTVSGLETRIRQFDGVYRGRIARLRANKLVEGVPEAENGLQEAVKSAYEAEKDLTKLFENMRTIQSSYSHISQKLGKLPKPMPLGDTTSIPSDQPNTTVARGDHYAVVGTEVPGYGAVMGRWVEGSDGELGRGFVRYDGLAALGEDGYEEEVDEEVDEEESGADEGRVEGKERDWEDEPSEDKANGESDLERQKRESILTGKLPNQVCGKRTKIKRFVLDSVGGLTREANVYERALMMRRKGVGAKGDAGD
ncbi:hypothetical protein HK102_005181 [Quaeritorhiza haematococci]|nr:hypothetical protein HK102_005181 [Quaeritorhiza haematococci]